MNWKQYHQNNTNWCSSQMSIIAFSIVSLLIRYWVNVREQIYFSTPPVYCYKKDNYRKVHKKLLEVSSSIWEDKKHLQSKGCVHRCVLFFTFFLFCLCFTKIPKKWSQPITLSLVSTINKKLMLVFISDHLNVNLVIVFFISTTVFFCTEACFSVCRIFVLRNYRINLSGSTLRIIMGLHNTFGVFLLVVLRRISARFGFTWSLGCGLFRLSLSFLWSFYWKANVFIIRSSPTNHNLI